MNSVLFILILLFIPSNSQSPCGPLNLCSGNGICIAATICSCSFGYTGPICNIPICYGITGPSACSGIQGICSSPDNCTCNVGYGGDQCEYNECFGLIPPVACGGVFQGTCIAHDTCLCTIEWNGTQCENPFCGSLTNPLACSGPNGICTTPSVCTCVPGWIGYECQTMVCFGIPAVDPSACTANGLCVGPNSCDCYPDFGGIDCSIPKCFGLEPTNPAVCSGNGVCSSLNTCTCNPGYGSVDCSTATCNGISNTSVLVCNSNGACIAPDICVCDTGYTGTFCQTTTCNGVSSLNPLVCSGNGMCIGLNDCDCDPNFDGYLCNSPIRPPPALCIVDKTFNVLDIDFGYIYFHTLADAVEDCKAQPIEYIKVSPQTIFEPTITFTRNNVNQTDLLIESLTPGSKPNLIGFNHILTSTFNSITINCINFMTGDYLNGTLSTPGTSKPFIIGGTTTFLNLTDVTFQAMPLPLSPPSTTNEPDVEYALLTTVSTGVTISNSRFYGSRKNSIEIVDVNIVNPISGSPISILNNVGYGNWGNFMYFNGIQKIDIRGNICEFYCGGIFTGERTGMITISYKSSVDTGFLIDSYISGNVVKINSPTIQSAGETSLTGIYIQGTGSSTTSVADISQFRILNNVANAYPFGLRLSGLSDDVIRLNYPPGHGILTFDVREPLRETAILNNINQPTIGDFQGTVHDVINSLPQLDITVSASKTCNDFCPISELCCDVNVEFNTSTTGFGSTKFNSVMDAIVNRPGGCAISPLILRCIRLTRGSSIGITDTWTHVEDVYFNTTEDLLFISEVNPVTGSRVRLVGNHVFPRSENYNISIERIRLHPADVNKPIFKTETIGIDTMQYSLLFSDLYFSPGNQVSDISNAGAICIQDISKSSIQIRNSIFKPNLAVSGTPVVKVQFSDNTPSDCGRFEFIENNIEQAKDNAISAINFGEMSFIENTITDCGIGNPLIQFSCIYMKACLTSSILSPPIVTDNSISGASSLGTNSFDVLYMTNDVKYSMLWLDTSTMVYIGTTSGYLSGIANNTYFGNIPVRERINGVIFQYSTDPPQIERDVIRSLNLANTGTAIFQETIFNIGDSNIQLRPALTYPFYCSMGCPIRDYAFIQILLIIIVVVAFVLISLFIFFLRVWNYSMTMKKMSLLKILQ